MKQIVNIWMQPIYERVNLDGVKRNVISFLFLPLLALLIGLLVCVTGNKGWLLIPLFFLVGLGASIFIYLMMWFIYLVFSIRKQYSPANATLVPTIKKNMQWAVIIPILIFPCLVAGFIQLIGKGDFFVVWIYVALVMLGMVMTLRTSWSAILIVVATQAPTILRKTQVSSFLTNNSELLFLLCLVLIFIAIHWTFFMSKERLFSRKEAIQSLSLMLKGEKSRRSSFLNYFNYAYFWGFNNLLQQSLIQPLNKLKNKKLFIFTLGPDVYFITFFIQFIFYSVLCICLMYALILLGGKQDQTDRVFMTMLFFPMAVGALILYPFSILGELYRTRGEQALMSLTVISGHHLEQTKKYLQSQLINFMLMWSVCVLLALVLSKVFELDIRLVQSMYLLVFCTMPMGLSLVKNHSQTRAVNDMHLKRWFALCFSLFIVSFGLSTLKIGVPVWILCVCISILCVLLLRSRWMLLQSVKAVFPVGRAV